MAKRWLHVWLDKMVPGVSTSEYYVEIPENDTADNVGKETLDTLISNELDTGWDEVDESEVPDEFKR